MPRQRRSRETLLALEWTAPLRWSDLPAELRDELRAQLHELLAWVARVEGDAEGAGDESREDPAGPSGPPRVRRRTPAPPRPGPPPPRKPPAAGRAGRLRPAPGLDAGRRHRR